MNTSVAALVCRLHGLYDQSTHLARRFRSQTRPRLRCRGHFLEDVSLHILHEERLRSARSPDSITTTSTASLASHTQFISDSNAKVAGGFSEYGAQTDRNAPSNVYVVSSQTNHVNRNRSNCVKFITTVEFIIKATSENIPTIVPTCPRISPSIGTDNLEIAKMMDHRLKFNDGTQFVVPVERIIFTKGLSTATPPTCQSGCTSPPRQVHPFPPNASSRPPKMGHAQTVVTGYNQEITSTSTFTGTTPAAALYIPHTSSREPCNYTVRLRHAPTCCITPPTRTLACRRCLASGWYFPSHCC